MRLNLACLNLTHFEFSSVFLQPHEHAHIIQIGINYFLCVWCQGCPAKRNFCMDDVCQNGGVCVSKWNTYSCDCPTGYGGKNCEQGKKCVNDWMWFFPPSEVCLWPNVPASTCVFTYCECVCVCVSWGLPGSNVFWRLNGIRNTSLDSVWLMQQWQRSLSTHWLYWH